MKTEKQQIKRRLDIMKKFLANLLVVLTLALSVVVCNDIDVNTNDGVETTSDGPTLNNPFPYSN